MAISDEYWAELLEERKQLLREKDENQEVLAACRAQIDAVKARVEDGGEYSDPIWFAKVNTRARYAGRRDQEIQHRLSEIKQIERQRWDEQHTLSLDDSEPRQLLISALQLIQQAVDLLNKRERNNNDRGDG